MRKFRARHLWTLPKGSPQNNLVFLNHMASMVIYESSKKARRLESLSHESGSSHDSIHLAKDSSLESQNHATYQKNHATYQKSPNLCQVLSPKFITE